MTPSPGQSVNRSSDAASHDRRIGVLILASSLCIGGAETVIRHLATTIDPARFRVLVRFTKKAGEIGAELEAAGLDVARLEGVKPGEVDYLTSFKLARAIRAARIDVVHTHTPDGLVDAALCRLRMRRPRVVHTFHFGNYPHVRPRVLWMERLGGRIVDRLLAVGDVQREQICKVHGFRDGAIGTVWNGVHVTRPAGDPGFRDRIGARGKLLIGTIATLIPQKGLPDLMRTARLVRDAGVDATFVVCGEGRMRAELEQLRRELGLETTVALPGWVTNAADTALPMFDIFFQPSLWEAMSVVTLEAMAAAKPVVVTAVGEAPRFVEHRVDGLVVPPADVGAMAEALLSLARDPAARDRIGQAARRKVEAQFTVGHMTRAYERIYAELAE